MHRDDRACDEGDKEMHQQNSPRICNHVYLASLFNIWSLFKPQSASLFLPWDFEIYPKKPSSQSSFLSSTYNWMFNYCFQAQSFKF